MKLTYYIKSNHDMGEIADESVICIPTSPPYNVGKDYGKTYKDNKSWDDYIDDLTKSAKEMYRVLKYTGSVFLNIGNRLENQFKSHDVIKQVFLENAGFKLKQTLIWHKFNGMPITANNTMKNNYEYIFVLCKDRSKVKIDKLMIGPPPSTRTFYDDREKPRLERRKNIYGKYVTDPGAFWSLYTTGKNAVDNRAGEHFHSAEFPLELPYTAMRITCYDPGEKHVVLDPWLGTGTTLLAARKACSVPYKWYPDGSAMKSDDMFMDIDAVGYEINPVFEKQIQRKIKMGLPRLRLNKSGVRRVSYKGGVKW